MTDGLDNVTVVEAALGAETGTVDMTGLDTPDHRGLGSVVPGHLAGLAENWFDGETCKVPQLRLGDLVACLRIISPGTNEPHHLLPTRIRF